MNGEREDGKTKKKKVHPGTVSVGNGITSHTKLSEKASRKEIHLAQNSLPKSLLLISYRPGLLGNVYSGMLT